ncbi:MAG: hypothetical protein BMS9Abin26_1391 [Gammaproteobacteria bacterium]|nr:MAG: hypothetical protein BMS9Abin26_1391 [Gammaproteobacteria bacterium]
MYRHIIKLAVLALVLVFLGGCAAQDEKKAGANKVPAEVSQAIKAASAAKKKAASVGGEWRNTGKFIKKAKKAAKKGHFKKAIKLANKAKREGELGYKQAMAEKSLYDNKKKAGKRMF